MPALKLTRLGATLRDLIVDSKNRAICQWPLLWQALMPALKLISLGSIPKDGICERTYKAISHCHPFSQALILALKLTSLGVTPARGISEKMSRAYCHCPSFPQALMAELKLISFGRTSLGTSGTKWSSSPPPGSPQRHAQGASRNPETHSPQVRNQHRLSQMLAYKTVIPNPSTR